MGTSVNQRSPRTANWSAVETAYTHLDISLQRTVQEIWRASSNEQDRGLVNDLGQPIIAQCVDIVRNANSPIEAGQKIRRLMVLSNQASLAGDIANRAAVGSFGKGGNPIDAFVVSLFSEASNYLVSRDIPGFVGLTDKVRTVRDVAEFKSSIIQEVVSKVTIVKKPQGDLSNPRTWKTYVDEITAQLTGVK
jgi:hypothetical protein